ncbi:Cathepsin Z [Porphyridium purpureum]|uniref:Cathepsin Z n=1 Tax=Porphyridium purpureum TaxID=35688 RepID=A0A5J4Z217_PORPP|nr:Cathepsin Z [Porphyridium purpureum]|eukprot:POR8174..scf295_1
MLTAVVVTAVVGVLVVVGVCADEHQQEGWRDVEVLRRGRDWGTPDGALVSREGLLLEDRQTRVRKHASAPAYANAKPVPAKSIDSMPEAFDWSNVRGQNFLVPNWNQHIERYCGACYIHGSLSAAQDRIKIAKKGLGPDIMLSRQALLNCISDAVGKNAGGGSEGCNGGTSQEVYDFMHKVGLPDETCNHWVAKATKKCDAEAMCMNCMAYAEPVMENNKCWPVKKYVKYFLREYGLIPQDEAAIMTEIFERGPVACSLATDDVFDYNYTGGVWTRKNNMKNSNHVVEVTGWGKTKEGVKFWQARNSWGSYWGDNGFFKILRGENHMLIEEDCWFTVPDWKEEQSLREGQVVGGMFGLREKPRASENDDLNFQLELEQMAESAAGHGTSASMLHWGSLVVTMLTGLVIGAAATAFSMRRSARANYNVIS